MNWGFLSMKKYLICLISALLLLISCEKDPAKGESLTRKSVNDWILKNNQNFSSQSDIFMKHCTERKSSAVLQEDLRKLRRLYKQMEWAVAYYQPHTAKFVNGPALPEIEWEEGTVLEPGGLQVLEELVFQETVPYEELERQLKLLRSNSQTINTYFSVNTLSAPQIMDALILQIHRITALGISGFDTPVSGWGLSEVSPSLEGIAAILGMLDSTASSQEKNAVLKEIKAIQSLTNKATADSFDYVNLIKNHLTPLLNTLQNFRLKNNIPIANVEYGINPAAKSLFAADAVNVSAFEEFPENLSREKLAALGAQLFLDPVLSDAENRSCTSCHLPEKAFTDGKAKSSGLSGQPLLRNTPSLNYSVFQHGQFWDMRKENLVSQSEDVISNKEEMHGDLKKIAKRLDENPGYKNLFQSVFGKTTVTEKEIKTALAAYIASLPRFNSAFDAFMNDKKSNYPDEAKRGFNIFMGKGKCATCHFLPVFNGTVPPDMTKTEQEVLGVPFHKNNAKLDTDPGRGRYYPFIPGLQRSFKTPTVRNASKTAPYMHNGVYATLEEVMDFYNKGGGKGLGLKADNQTLPEDPLSLSREETAAVIRFLQTLTDR